MDAYSVVLSEALVVQHSPIEKKWVLNDVRLENGLSFEGVSATPICPQWSYLRSRWMVPRQRSQYSAGVRLQTIEPCCVIPTHLGKVLLVRDLEKKELEFVTLSSFFDGVYAVRHKFERELEEGRRTANTGEERVANLRACREEMMANSDRIVKEHMKLLPVDWKEGVAGKGAFEWMTVLLLTTPDGRAVEGRDETNFALLGMDEQFEIRVGKKGEIEAQRRQVDRVNLRRFSPVMGTRVFWHFDKGVHVVRYVRDSDANTDVIVKSEIAKLKDLYMPPHFDAIDSGRWLMLVATEWSDVVIYDTEKDKMAYLQTSFMPRLAEETSEGLWLTAMDGSKLNPPGTSTPAMLLTREVLESLDLASTISLPQVGDVRHRVVDEELDAEAFCRDKLGRTHRRADRHPGHYWVVAGYGPVPTRLRAPEHIYQQLEFRGQVEQCRGFPLWVGVGCTRPWVVKEPNICHWVPYWVGVVDVRDEVTSESIKVNPKTDAWRDVVIVGEDSVERGEFLVTGNVMSMCSKLSLEVPVTPGRWLWQAESDGAKMKITFRHESVSADEDVPPTAWKPLLFTDKESFKHCMARLNELSGLIPQEKLRAKIAQFSESVRGCALPFESFALADKQVMPEDSETLWCLENVLSSDEEANHVVPLTGGIGVFYRGADPSCCIVDESMFRIEMPLFAR